MLTLLWDLLSAPAKSTERTCRICTSRHMPFTVADFYTKTLIIFVALFAVDINDCAGVTCSNGASCRDLVNAFACRCAPGYDGRLCENGTITSSQPL